jgi:hypothetical protein
LLILDAVGLVAVALAAPAILEVAKLTPKEIPSRLGTFITAIVAIVIAIPAVLIALLLKVRRLLEPVIDPTDYHFRPETLTRQCNEQTARGTNLSAWAVLERDAHNLVASYNQDSMKEVAACRSHQREPVAAKQVIAQKFVTVVDEILARIERDRDMLMGYRDVNEIYFFDLFELRGDDHLYLLARKKTPSAIEHRRRWPVGEGHVGDAVNRAKPLLINYKRTPRKDYDAQVEPTDKDYFGCRITVPISSRQTRKHDAFGALVLTSSNAERLTDEHLTTIENLSYVFTELFFIQDKLVRKIDDHAKRDAKKDKLGDVAPGPPPDSSYLTTEL